MAATFDNILDESQLQAPKALRGELGAFFRAAPPVPAALDAAILASARHHLTARRRTRAAIRWAGLAAAAAAAAIFLILIHLGPESETPARVAAKPAAAKPTSTAPVVAKAASADRADTNGDGKVDILDAFLLAKRLEARRALNAAWDITGDGLIDRRDVDAIAAAAVRLERRIVQ
ncbi:MAG: hypothetical protein FJ290_20490 [Planctomycetes bacterium]|nr:hypothetical protein [Planctomycetota bacterium]